jgi:tRNA1(Val) A37 N6-methylase TrmN6
MIIPVGRLPELFSACEAARLVPRQLRAVHSHRGEPARRLLVEAGRGRQGDFQVLPELTIHDADRKAYTVQARAIIDGEWLPPSPPA